MSRALRLSLAADRARSSAVWLLAGIVALSARPGHRRAVAYYLGAALPFLMLTAVWNRLLYGSPFTTGYQAAGAGPNGQVTLAASFSPAYAFGAPWAGDGTWLGGAALNWHLPNAATYLLQLAGVDRFLSWPGVGILGFAALVRFAKRRNAYGVLGRFGIVAVPTIYLTYAPYFWQSGRFLVGASLYYLREVSDASSQKYPSVVMIL